jgi:hypothetical protein
MKTPMTPAVRSLEEQVDYRLPTSGKPQTVIALPRETAEELLREIYSLYLRLERQES